MQSKWKLLVRVQLTARKSSTEMTDNQPYSLTPNTKLAMQSTKHNYANICTTVIATCYASLVKIVSVPVEWCNQHDGQNANKGTLVNATLIINDEKLLQYCKRMHHCCHLPKKFGSCQIFPILSPKLSIPILSTPLIYGSLGLPKFISQSASWSVWSF